MGFGSNSNIFKQSEFFVTEDGIRIPTKLFGDNIDFRQIKLEKIDLSEKDAQFNMQIQEMNKKLLDWINNPPDSPKWKIENFNQLQIRKIQPIELVDIERNLKLPGQLEDQINIGKIQMIDSLIHHHHANVHHEEKCEESVVEPIKTLEVKDNKCQDKDIELIIHESLISQEEKDENKKPDWAICSLAKTEYELYKDIRNSNNATKFMVVYIILMLPLFIQIVMQSYGLKNSDLRLANANNACFDVYSSYRNNKAGPINILSSSNSLGSEALSKALQ